MELINDIIITTLNSFDFTYCVVVNLLTYYAILIANTKNNKNITIWQKRLILVLVLVSTGIVYYFTGKDINIIFNSAILAPVFWSWILKPLCKHFKIDYNDIGIIK